MSQSEIKLRIKDIYDTIVRPKSVYTDCEIATQRKIEKLWKDLNQSNELNACE